MSKIAIVLCVALFATAADSAFDGVFNDKSDIVVGRVVHNIISKVELDMRYAYEGALADIEIILSQAFKKVDDFSKKIVDVMVKSQTEYGRMYVKYKEKLTVECIQMPKSLWEIGGLSSRAMAKANECIIEELKKGFLYMDGMGFEYGPGLANITSMKAEVEGSCKEMKDRFYASDWKKLESTVDARRAIWLCPETVAVKTYEISVAVISGLTSRVKLLTDWWKTAIPKIDACTSVSHLQELHKESTALLEATKQCFEATKL